MNFDLVNRYAVFGLFLEQFSNEVVELGAEHLLRILRLCRLYQPVEFLMLVTHERIFPSSQEEKSDSTGPYVI